MSTNRVVMGVQNDGSVGLRVSAVGVDADVGNGQGGDFTFNSDWTDISKIHQIGTVSYAASGVKYYTASFPTGPATTAFGSGYGFLYTSLGYRPFMEARLVSGGNVVQDDYVDATVRVGGAWSMFYDCARNGAVPTTTYTFIYIVYKIAAAFPGGTW